MALKIQLFGKFLVWRDDVLIPLLGWSKKSQDLLKILVGSRGQVFLSDQLIESLWPGVDPERARANLRNCVKELRHRLEPNLKSGLHSHYILTVPDGYCFNREAECILDTEEFAEHYHRGMKAEEQGQLGSAIKAYETAIGIYRGEYLAENRYDDWSSSWRESWREEHLEVLSRLAECYARLGRPWRAIACMQQALHVEKYRESLYERLMLYYYLAGEPGMSQQIYEQCTEALAELGVTPAPSLEELREHIRRGTVPGSDRYPPSVTVKHPQLLGQLPFVGRAQEFSRLADLLQQARAGKGRMVVLSGEAGVGKTRLLQELTSYAQQQGIRVFQGRCSETLALGAYEPIRAALRAGLRELEPEDLKRIEPRWLAEVAELLPELRTRLPELPSGLELPGEQKRRRLHQGLLQLLIDLAQPALVFSLDDLQWADPSTIEFLSDLLFSLPQHPLLILGAYRQEAVFQSALATLICEGRAKKRLRVLSLKGLSPGEVERLLRALTPRLHKLELFSRRIYRETQGNPFFMLSVLQNLFEAGVIRIDEEGGWVTDVDEITVNYRELIIPKEMREVIERRVGRLEEREQELLQLAAVIGHSFDRELLKRAWSGKAFHQLLRELTQRGLLREQRLAGRPRPHIEYEFVHDKVREVVYHEIEPAVRRELHRRIAEAFEALSASREQSAWLAHHYAQAGDFAKALHYGITALTRAVEQYQWQEGLALADQALQWAEKLRAGATPAGELLAMRFEILSKRAVIYDALGRHREQEQDTQELVALAEALQADHRRAKAHEERSKWYRRVGHYSDAQAQALKSLRLQRKLGDQAGELTVLNLLGRIHADAGDYQQAQIYTRRALKLAQGMGDRAGEASALNTLGVICTDLGQHQESLAYYEQAGRIWQELGDRNAEGSFLNNAGVAAERLGDYPNALAYFTRAQQLAEELLLPDLNAFSLYGKGWVLRDVGRYRQALELCKQAVRIAHEIRHSHLEAHILNGLGDILRQLGDLKRSLAYHEKAYSLTHAHGGEPQALVLHHGGLAHWGCGDQQQTRSCWERSLALAKDAGLKLLEIQNCSWLGVLWFWAAKSEKALEESRRAVALLEEAAGPLPLRTEVYFNHLRVLAMMGREAEAKPFLEKAHQSMMAIAAKLTEKTLKASYLGHIRMHRHILQAMEKLARGKGLLTQRQKRAISHVVAHRAITNREYRRLFGVSNVTAAQDLRDLEDCGFLKMIGKGRSVRYIPV